MRRIRLALFAGTSCALLLIAMSCGGGSSSSKSSGGGSPTTVNTANTVAVSVNGGPSTKFALTNGMFVSVTVCQPGSNSCVTVPDVLLDTGSTGLRLLSGAVSGITLPHVTSGGMTLTNCVQYLDNSYNWGPVATADVNMAGEVASSVPFQIIAQPGDTFPAAPASCGGTANNTVDTLLANGILGISFFQEDCGSACTPGTVSNGGNYYACSATTCSLTTASSAQQLQNPIGLFAADNNGLAITLPSVPATGVASLAGTLQFGIGTQSDNALGSAVVITPDAFGNFSSTFKTTSTSVGFIDSGSTALFFLDTSTTGLPACTTNAGFYCPSSTQSLTATNKGSNGATSTVSFSVGNADTLLNSNSDVFSNVAGTGTDPTIGPYFDWGVPFFLGRTVFVALEGKSAGGSTGPYWAY
jgi:hypothetical protein